MRACRSAIKFHSLVFFTNPKQKSRPIPSSKTKHKILCYRPLCLKVSSGTTPPRVHAYASYSDEVQNGAYGAYDRTVRVQLILHKECRFGEEFCAVGEAESLGSWDPQGAAPMKWNPGHIWTTPTMDLPVGKDICFKFILRDQEGEIQWQPGPDRVFHSCETRGTLIVSLGWDDVEVQITTEEEEEGGGYEEEIAESGAGRVEGGGIDGWVPVLVPGLKSEADSGGECEYSSIGNVPVLVPGLKTVMDDDRDSQTEESQNEAHEEKEELVSGGENSYAVFDDHASVSDAEEALTISNGAETSVVDTEEASTSAAMESVKNQDTTVSSESSCNEGEDSDSVKYPVGSSVLQKDFDWGRSALSKLIWSLGLKDE